MKKFFKNWRSLKIVLIASLSSLFLFLVLVGFFSFGWRLMPKALSSKIALEKLIWSAHENPFCHEECFWEREVFRRFILEQLKSEKYKTFLAIKVSKILPHQGLENELTYFFSRLEREAARELQALIIKNNPSLSSLDIFEFSFNRSEDSWDIFINGEDLKLRNLAFYKLSLIKDKKNFFDLKKIEELKKIVLAEETNLHLRRLVALLLASLATENNKFVLEIFATAYKMENIDPFTRSAMFPILEAANQGKYEAPLISEEDLSAYQAATALGL